MLLALGQRKIYEGFAGLHFKNGKFVAVLGPGNHRFLSTGNDVVVVDMRKRSEVVGGQEIVTKDGGSIRLSVIVNHHIENPELNFRSGEVDLFGNRGIVSNVSTRLHQLTQIAMREWIGSRTLQEALANRTSLATDLLPDLAAEATELGIKLLSIDTLDFSITGGLKAAYSDLLKVEIEGQVALARARNESSTMRSLLNTARLVREHPGLLELRVLASGQKPRVTFVVNGKDSVSEVVGSVPEES